MAGVALGHIHLDFVWQACHVAGVALGDMDLHFAWQAWAGVALMALGWLWWRALES